VTEASNSESASLLRRLRISTRIYASITTLLVLFLFSIGIACFGLIRLKANVQRYAQADKLATIIDRIDRDIIELQRDVLVFAASGNASAPQRIERVGQNLRDQIAEAMTYPNNEDTSYRLTEMQTRLNAYLENFPAVIEERETRQQLVGVTLRELESQTQPAFDRLRYLVINSSSNTKPDREPNVQSDSDSETIARDEVLVVERSMSLVALAQLKALRFFDDPDVSAVRESLKLLGDAQTELLGITDLQDDQVTKTANDVVGLINDYESAFLRAVQATRGYLSLVNVVMAGEAAEFLYQSQQIQKQTSLQSSQISSATVTTASRSTIAAIAIALSALAVALIVMWTVAQGIVNPISAMTSTFSQLMLGHNNATIPGLERTDEIGDMARAADMFRDRNRQTEELLHQSRQLAQELDQNARELARSNEDLNSFAYVASHDLRSPLRAIDNISSWIVEDVGDQIPDESKEHLGELRRRVRRMEQLLNELLEYSRVGLGFAKVSETDLSELVNEMTDLLDLPADANVVIDGETPVIRTDRGLLSRVLLNLLSNAIKYRSDKPLTIHCQCDIDGDVATFRVRDNGIGVAPEFHSRIFEMFKRLHRQSEIEGTGMGLALVKKIVNQVGGTIDIESAVDEGSTFFFTWPIGESTKIEQQYSSSQPSPASANALTDSSRPA
tara:strand:+ start:230900 stop:232921 length:2022 start_codon:yes stop_codon:yes gene_type:complete